MGRVPRMLSRIGRGRRPAVDFVVCFGWGGFFFRFFFLKFFFLERTRPAARMMPSLASFTSLLIMITGQGRESEATESVFFLKAKQPLHNDNEAVFCLQAKKPLHTGVHTGCHYLISLSVCACV